MIIQTALRLDYFESMQCTMSDIVKCVTMCNSCCISVLESIKTTCVIVYRIDRLLFAPGI